MKIILVRHGETDWNKQRRLQGQSDIELNAKGKKQVEALAQALKNRYTEAIYTSPLKRALDTAQAIGRHHHVDIIPLDQLKEIDAGEMDGLTHEEMKKQFSDFYSEWQTNCTKVSFPGGSSLPELQERVWSAIEGILNTPAPPPIRGRKTPERTVIVVAHFFPIMSIVCRALGLDLSQCRRLRLDLASICAVDIDNGNISLVSLNDTCHCDK